MMPDRRTLHRVAVPVLILLAVMLSAGYPIDNLARDVGVTVILEPGAPFEFFAGDTIQPRARIRNYGTEAVQEFPVVFRIGPTYSRVITAPGLEPGATLEVRFPVWKAIPGRHLVSCSTMLDGDQDPTNDRRARSIEVFYPAELRITPDRFDRIELGSTHRYRYEVKMHGDNGDDVELLPFEYPRGWRVRFYDSTGTQPLRGRTRYRLGFIPGRESRSFVLEIGSPDILPDTVLPRAYLFNITAVVVGDSTVRDSALLSLTPVPAFEVHNYPNPFSTQTRFIIGLPEEATVSLTIYDRAGTLIRRLIDAENHIGPTVISREWNGTNQQGRPVAPAVYHYLLEVTRDNRTERIRKRLVIARD